MKTFLVVLVSLLLLCNLASAFSVGGHITGGQSGLFLSYVAAVPARFDTFYLAIGLPILNTYSFANLDSGGYFLVAFQDINRNFIPDATEPRGYYGGQVPQVLQVNQNLSNIDIALQASNTGGFSGQLTYNGINTGTMYVRAFRDAAMQGTPAGIGFVLDTTGNHNYTAYVDTFGTFYAMAFLDLNGNFTYDTDEPMGIYGGDAAVPIAITPTSSPTGINILLHDAASVPEKPNPVPSGIALGEVYPNPFNSTTRVSFVLNQTASVDLSLYDLMGREVLTVARGTYAPGEHQLLINADALPTGVCLLRLKSGSFSQSKKLLLLK